MINKLKILILNIYIILIFLLSIAASYAIAIYNPPDLINRFIKLNDSEFRTGLFWERSCNGVKCTLCPFKCFLPEGFRGICKARMNSSGELKTLVYGRSVAVHIDPIEKKPVYHLLPGTRTFSIATAGCNLGCTFCQNWTISQIYPEQGTQELLLPEDIVKNTLQSGCESISFTYSEPVIFYEYMLDTAKISHRFNLKNIMVSAGYINKEPLLELIPYLDTVKIDLKGFNNDFYKKYIKGSLNYVLSTLILLKDNQILTEVVNLVVPTLNDNPEEIRYMSEWIFSNLGKDTPLFFSKFSPQYKINNIQPTSDETLTKFREIALSAGLNFVYIGNIPGSPGENTYCPKCKNIIIGRYGYFLTKYALKGQKCFYCGNLVPGIWRTDTNNMRTPWERRIN